MLKAFFSLPYRKEFSYSKSETSQWLPSRAATNDERSKLKSMTKVVAEERNLELVGDVIRQLP